LALGSDGSVFNRTDFQPQDGHGCSPWRAGRRRADHFTTYLARVDDRIVGFLTLVTLPGEVPEIRTIGVLPEARGKGLGRQLILRALSALAKTGHDECVLTVSGQNRHALGLYRKLGFCETDHFNVYRFNSGSDRRLIPS
jgi:ribosomal protein S18 acetylase RimI-like enzyme